MAQQEISAECILGKTKCSSSSGSDDEFEKFLSRMKTPKSATYCTPRAESKSLNDSKENLFWHRTSKKGARHLHTPNTSVASGRGIAHPVPFLSPLAFSDSGSDDDCVFSKYTARSPCHSIQGSCQKWNGRSKQSTSSWEKPIASRDRPKSSQSVEERGSTKECTQGKAQQPRPSVEFGSNSSDDEIDSLIVRLKQRMVFPDTKNTEGQTSTAGHRGFKPTCESIQATMKSENASLTLFQPPVPAQFHKSQVLTDVLQVPKMPMRSSCQVQGCFLQELSDPESQQAKQFRTKKEDMAQRLYVFYNSTVFEQKLPEKMEISWNKKMRKTAGCCITGQLKDPNLVQRYARIMLSEKVCDSADRLRDTLIHELCHAAAWLIHGVQDGHGQFWGLYARKSALIHPELPVVSRCHNYEIKYKFTYECCRCQNTIGRHSKSLDTQRFVCALCKGQLVLRQPTRKDGTPAKAPLTPFAKYVKENYVSAKQLQQGLSHGAIMKKLSADFASQQSLDLLGKVPQEKLDIKLCPDGSGQLHVPFLTEFPVNCLEDINKIFDFGHRNRAIECTCLNEHSSRSHALLIVTVRGVNHSTGIRTTGKLNLIDLAGSEQVGRSGAEGSRLQEARYINKSLLALGDVIYALHSRQGHVLLRNSKLTYLLQDSVLTARSS